MRKIEIWADSFHEGSWCCDNLMKIASEANYTVNASYRNGLLPVYTFTKEGFELELTVYGSYRSWSPIPTKIADLIDWGKPDFLAYDATNEQILFAVEETAATPTGNQATQRCERQYGSARFHIPYWYLISEYGVHRDGGTRRDSIWPTVAAIKLSVIKETPCVVLHYSDIANPEDYSRGSGVGLLFQSLFSILVNHTINRSLLFDMRHQLTIQYQEMLQFLLSQWSSIIDFLPSQDLIQSPRTAEIIAEIATGDTSHRDEINGLLEWPTIPNVPEDIRNTWESTDLLKHDPLCAKMEQDIDNGYAYYLSNRAGSGRPPKTEDVLGWIRQQNNLFSHSDPLFPPCEFSMKIENFPFTYEGSGRHHITTAKNIVYLYDSWQRFVDTLVSVYPRLGEHFHPEDHNAPVFVYVCNSISPGRLFGDPFTGQLAAYSTAFGKLDRNKRIVVAYYPHQVHTQAITGGENKGKTLMSELTDYAIFHAGVAVKMSEGEVM